MFIFCTGIVGKVIINSSPWENFFSNEIDLEYMHKKKLL